MRRSLAFTALLVACGAVLFAGCGRDDFENEPRPPVPAEITVELGPDGVVISPEEFGAGLVNFTIANLTQDAASLEISPIGAEPIVASEDVPPRGNTIVKVEMPEGEYEAQIPGSDAEPFEFTVGPERESAQDELLLP